MTIVKTAVSIESELFKKAEDAAEKLNISRSRLFQLALANYISQYENLSILDRLNSVYSEKISEHEQDFQKLMKTYHEKHLEDKW
jgi:metal-responsive CopG/Arc/MetJ family transcriptional regulator